MVSRDCHMWCHVMMESRDTDYSIYGVDVQNLDTAVPFYILLTALTKNAIFHLMTSFSTCCARNFKSFIRFDGSMGKYYVIKGSI